MMKQNDASITISKAAASVKQAHGIEIFVNENSENK